MAAAPLAAGLAPPEPGGPVTGSFQSGSFAGGHVSLEPPQRASFEPQPGSFGQHSAQPSASSFGPPRPAPTSFKGSGGSFKPSVHEVIAVTSSWTSASMGDSPVLDPTLLASTLTDGSAPMTSLAKASYAVGHVLNDLTAACWFSYLLVYITKALGLGDAVAGAVLLSGQLADAAATPVVGVLSDKSAGCLGLGKRKSWNLAGAAIVAACFGLVFAPPVAPSEDMRLPYLAVAAALFNVGWAANQVSHLTLAPELSNSSTERTGLYSKRYACTVLANIVVFALFAVFTHMNGVTQASFKHLSVVVVALGVTCTFFFAVGTTEKVSLDTQSNQCLARECIEEEDGQSEAPQSGARAWLRNARFHRVAAAYTATRLVVNGSQVYLPVSLSEMGAADFLLGVVPMEVYASSFLVSFGVKSLSKRLGRAVVYGTGALLTAAGTVGLGLVLSNRLTGSWPIHICAVLLGAGSCCMLVTSIALQADLIGVVRNSNGNGFVYGYCSMLDKLSNGVVVFILQIYLQEYKASKGEILTGVWLGIAALSLLAGVWVALLSSSPRS